MRTCSKITSPEALPGSTPPTPCACCGYLSSASDVAPGGRCQLCGESPAADSPLAHSPPGSLRARLAVALEALPQGAHLLATTPGTKRWLLPPVLVTLALYLVGLGWAWGQLRAWSASALDQPANFDSLQPAWLGHGLAWCSAFLAHSGLASASVALLFWLCALLVFWFSFPLVFEVLAGPFLERVQARIETRWFGFDPRQRLEQQRPRATRRSACARQLWLMASAWCSTLIALGLLVLALPLHLLPLLGSLLYGVVAGFATGLALLDLSFERREWNLRRRWHFLWRHRGVLALYGLVCGIVFSFPLLGPIVFAPCASVGGLWLVVRLDKRAP